MYLLNAECDTSFNSQQGLEQYENIPLQEKSLLLAITDDSINISRKEPIFEDIRCIPAPYCLINTAWIYALEYMFICFKNVFALFSNDFHESEEKEIDEEPLFPDIP